MGLNLFFPLTGLEQKAKYRIGLLLYFEVTNAFHLTNITGLFAKQSEYRGNLRSNLNNSVIRGMLVHLWLIREREAGGPAELALSSPAWDARPPHPGS